MAKTGQEQCTTCRFEVHGFIVEAGGDAPHGFDDDVLAENWTDFSYRLDTRSLREPKVCLCMSSTRPMATGGHA